MHVAADAVGGADFLHAADGGYGVVEAFAVDGLQFAVLEGEAQLFGAFLLHLLEVSLLGQALGRVEDFAAADAGAPDADVVGILQLGEVGIEAVCVQVVHLFLAREVAVAREGDDFHVGAHHEERHVEAHLVVARSGGAVGDGVGHSLEDALGGDGDGVDVVAQHVAENHVLQALLVVLLRHVERHVLRGAELVGVLFVGLELFGAEAARVGAGGIYFVALLLGEVHDRVGRVQTAAEGYHYFLLCHGREGLMSLSVGFVLIRGP